MMLAVSRAPHNAYTICKKACTGYLFLNERMPFLFVSLLFFHNQVFSVFSPITCPDWLLLWTLELSSADSWSIDETCQGVELEKGKGNCQESWDDLSRRDQIRCRFVGIRKSARKCIPIQPWTSAKVFSNPT